MHVEPPHPAGQSTGGLFVGPGGCPEAEKRGGCDHLRVERLQSQPF